MWALPGVDVSVKQHNKLRLCFRWRLREPHQVQCSGCALVEHWPVRRGTRPLVIAAHTKDAQS